MNKPLVPIEELLVVWSSTICHRQVEVARPFYLISKLSEVVWVPLMCSQFPVDGTEFRILTYHCTAVSEASVELPV